MMTDLHQILMKKECIEWLNISIDNSVSGNQNNQVSFVLETNRGGQFEDPGFSGITVHAKNISAAPQAATINGESVSFTYDADRQKIEFDTFTLSEGQNVFEFAF